VYYALHVCKLTQLYSVADGDTMSATKSFPDLTIDLFDQEALLAAARKLVCQLRPEWADKEDLMHRVFSGGISNVLVGYYLQGDRDDCVLVRVYGHNTDLLVDRKAEIRNMRAFHAQGIGPALLATFANGIAYEYVAGEMFTYEMIVDPAVVQLVVEMFAQMHRIPVERKEAVLFDRMRQFHHFMRDDGFAGDDVKAKRYVEWQIPSKDELFKEIEDMEAALKDVDCPVVFCHNDLLLGNIVLGKKEGKQTVTFIDHEYGEANYAAFDIGDHFTEFPGVGENLDYSLYPDEAFQKDWLRRYLKASQKGEEEPSDEEVHRWYRMVQKFALCAHLKWALWALVQAANSSIDFDFIDYSGQRLAEYRKRKAAFLAIK